MLKNKLIRIFLGSLCVLGLVLTRGFEDDLFYDPLKYFFKGYNYPSQILPDMNHWLLFLNYFLRFLMNTILSLGLIFLFFLDKNILKFSALLYGIAFAILTVLFFGLMKTDLVGHQTLFYIRRFIIHPIFVLLFIPGFFYQKSFKFDNENSPDSSG
jgi:exosortase F-associated protein